MHQLVLPWCSDVNGLLLPNEKGIRVKFTSGGLKGPALRASLPLPAASHRVQVVGMPSCWRQGSPCVHQ